MSVLGFIESGAQIGIQQIVIKPTRGFRPAFGANLDSIVAQAVIEEVHTDDMEVTDHPVEEGSTISDHAFARPSEVVITCGWSNSPNATSLLGQIGGFAASQSDLAKDLIAAGEFISGVQNLLSGNTTPVVQVYAQLLQYYQARTLFLVYTGKRVYKNMIIRSLSTATTKETENSLIVRVTCKEIITVQTKTVTVPSADKLADPQGTLSPQDTGVTTPVPAPNINVSALPSVDGFQPDFSIVPVS